MNFSYLERKKKTQISLHLAAWIAMVGVYNNN
jgi:hypothetical protein